MQADPNPRYGSRNHIFNRHLKSGESPEKQSVPEGERFFEAACVAVCEAGCELLFEVPTAIFGQPGDRAVAIRKTDEHHSLCFLLLRSDEAVVSIVTAGEAPETAIEFTMAYVKVLSLLASDRKITAPLLQ